MNKSIKYIGFYDIVDNAEEKRAFSLAASNKMDYVSYALKDIGYQTHIISPSWITNSEAKYQKRRTINIDSYKKLTLTPSFGARTKIAKYLRILFSLAWLTFFLVKESQKKEVVIAYHSPWLLVPLLITKKIKKIKIVLELEEIHSEVWQLKKLFSLMEKRLINIADEYILVTEKLKERIGVKDAIILHGSYFPNLYLNMKKQYDLIKVVYAGSIDKVKSGAIRIVKASKYLPCNYEVYILGFGAKEDIDAMLEAIDSVNKVLGRQRCFYLGVKTGEEFNRFLQQCHIGVNSQLVGQYMATAFPSKILTYMANGLKVVSTKVETVMSSKLSPLIVFANDDQPISIAEAISNVDVYDDNKDNEIKKLHIDFVKGLKSKIEGDKI